MPRPGTAMRQTLPARAGIVRRSRHRRRDALVFSEPAHAAVGLAALEPLPGTGCGCGEAWRPASNQGSIRCSRIQANAPTAEVTPISQATPSCVSQGGGGRYSLTATGPSRHLADGGSPMHRQRVTSVPGRAWQGATRRPTARSATAHAREGSSREPHGCGRPRSRIVARSRRLASGWSP
jgi:hypothetical protein